MDKVLFLICFIVAVVLFIAGFIVPPTGVIDPSVLKAAGFLFAFAALAQAPTFIDKISHATFKKGDTEITIHGDDHDHDKKIASNEDTN